MSINPVVLSQNCLQNCFNGIQSKVYTVHKKVCGLCSTDTKVYAFLILGRMLQAAALVGFAASVAFTIFSGPVALVGVISAVAVGLLGTYIAGNPQELNDILQMARPFVVGQPIGLRNAGNNCWLNSSLQLLAHVPAFAARMRQIPEFAQFLDAYAASGLNFEKVSHAIDPQTIRQYLSAQLGREVVGRDTANRPITAPILDPGGTQQDASLVFDFLFEGQNALYTFEQQINGAASPNQVEPMIPINLVSPGVRPNVQQLFNARFDYQNDLGQRVQQFFPQLPNDLLIKAGRFVQRNHPDTGAFIGLEKINDPLDISERLQVPNQFVRTNETADYVCDAFVIHNGATANGGHYTSYIKTGNVWWYTSDRVVYEVSAAHALEAMKHGYIFHYARA